MLFLRPSKASRRYFQDHQTLVGDAQFGAKPMGSRDVAQSQTIC